MQLDTISSAKRILPTGGARCLSRHSPEPVEWGDGGSPTRWIAVGTDALMGPKVSARNKADVGIGPYHWVERLQGVGENAFHPFGSVRRPYGLRPIGAAPA